jgi:hypothetical protein
LSLEARAPAVRSSAVRERACPRTRRAWRAFDARRVPAEAHSPGVCSCLGSSQHALEAATIEGELAESCSLCLKTSRRSLCLDSSSERAVAKHESPLK